MRKTPYISVVVLLIVFLCGATFTLSADPKKDSGKQNLAKKDSEVKAEPVKDSLKRYYDDEVVFSKLSGAAQSALLRIYGPKKGNGALGIAPAISNLKKKQSAAPTAPSAVLVNVPVNDPTLDLTAQNTQSETSIVLGSSSNNIVVGYNDSGECTNLCNNAQHFTGYSYSTNGGTSFIDGGALPDDPVFPFGDVGDPVLARSNAANTIHFSTLGFNYATGDGPSLKCFRSTDDGATWSTRVDCTPGMPATDFQDKQWHAVDNTGGPGNGNIYLAWRQFSFSNPQGIRFVRSTDGGLTWGPSGGTLIADQGAFNVQGAYVAVGPTGTVYVFWLDQSAGGGTPHILRGRLSTDQGSTWSAPEDIHTFENTNVNGDLGLQGGFRSNGFPHADIAQTGTFVGHILLTFADFHPVNGDPDVFTIECSDGDLNLCGGPVRLNDDTGTNDQFMPTVAWTTDGNAANWSWYDRRRDPGNNLIERWSIIIDEITGPTPNYLVSDNPFPPVFGADPVVNSVYMGDYDQTVADASNFYSVFLDTEGGTQDVVFVKTPEAGPGVILGREGITTDDSAGNNNGQIDFNECIGMDIDLSNLGTADATGVTATLSTTTPGVTINTANSAYPDIAVGATQTNSTPFQFSTSPSFVCGTTIDFTLTVNTASTAPDGGSQFVFNFSVPTGGVGSPVQFDNNVVTPLVDNGTVDIPFNVSGFTGSLGKVTVDFHLTQTWDGDMDISLIAPNGDAVELTTDNGGNGDNYGTSCGARTAFDDDAATSITAGSPPYVGTFRPEGFLADFRGKTGADVNGTWLLRLTDDFAQDTGSYFCGSLFLSPTDCTDGGGACAGGACSYEELFDDGVLTYLVLRPTVVEVGGFLTLTQTSSKKAYVTSGTDFAAQQNGTYTAEMRFSAAGFKPKSSFFTHWVDKKHNIEVMINFQKGTIIIKQRNGTVVAKAKGNFAFAADTTYSVSANYDGTDYEVSVDGTPVVTLTPVGTIPAGILAFTSRNMTTQVDRVCVTP